MKLKILKLLVIFLFLLPLCAALLGPGCNKEEWNELQLADNFCTDIISEEIGYIDNHAGILIPSDSETPAFAISADEYGDLLPHKTILFPCNLPQKNLFHKGQEIVFSGVLSSWKGSGSDSIVGDAFSIPIILTNAKVKN